MIKQMIPGYEFPGGVQWGIFMGLMSPRMDGTNVWSIFEPYRSLIVRRSWRSIYLVGASDTKSLGDMIGQAATRYSNSPLWVSQGAFR